MAHGTPHDRTGKEIPLDLRPWRGWDYRRKGGCIVPQFLLHIRMVMKELPWRIVIAALVLMVAPTHFRGKGYPPLRVDIL